ncbi:MAG: FAD:protein FMN transferase [Granulosicoccaceae bacterium]|jgi:thiamine biosynthesis lipoprotein
MKLPAFIFKTILWLNLALLPTACSQPEPPVFHETVLSFGTLVEVTMYGVEDEQASRAYNAILDDLNYMHNTWHAWQPNALARINNLLQTGAEFSLAPSVLPLIIEARELSAQSHGLFNPAIGKLVRLWGFHAEFYEDAQPPEAEQIQALLDAAPGMQDIHIEGLTMYGSNPQLQLDFGAFAKGYAVDVVIEHLREFGIENAIINAGGDLRAIGSRGERPWHIGIRHPDGKGVIASLDLQGDESVFTSGNYERYYEMDGKRYHHIIDPRTGYPAEGTQSVTVLHDKGSIADAAATALFVAGPDAWPAIARDMGIEHVMLIADDGRVQMTPAMQARIRFEVEPAPQPEIIPLQ